MDGVNDMKKLDLHVHTQSTMSDIAFVFSMESLRKYVTTFRIDGIAITNHNLFDANQYFEITKNMPEQCAVFPGIEINIKQSNNIGHILCITSVDDVYDFETRCHEVSKKINSPTDGITLCEMESIFTNMEKYLWIPHYDKKPNLDKNIIKNMGKNVLCGEVRSVKKFIYCIKNKNALTPVYFSDYRPTDEQEKFPLRQTFFDINEITISSIKKCLIDKAKVTLSEKEGNHIFYVLPDVPISTRLNVIIGERSSGKTHMLNEIFSHHENVKYIKQFSLIEIDPSKEGQNFNNRIAMKQDIIVKDFFYEFSKVVDSIKEIPENYYERLDKYLDSLIQHAEEIDRADMFSKCLIYNESSYQTDNLQGLKNLINAVELLLDSKQYEDIIDTFIEKDRLKLLFKALIQEYRKKYCEQLKKNWVNGLMKNIQASLQAKTANTKIEDVDFYSLQIHRHCINKFKIIVDSIKKRTVIHTNEIGDFTVQVTKRPYESATEMKNTSKKKISFADVFKNYYNGNAFIFLQKLKELDVNETEYYKYFSLIEYKILNKYGYEVSGGERAEFNLLQEIKDALKYDMLLIDEPESSFDNIFLREKVNEIIRDIAREMPVIIVTHNNTVGASIHPDFIIHTKRFITAHHKIQYARYYGLPSDKTLKDCNANELSNIDVTLDCLEAGEEAYNERSRDYEILKN